MKYIYIFLKIRVIQVINFSIFVIFFLHYFSYILFKWTFQVVKLIIFPIRFLNSSSIIFFQKLESPYYNSLFFLSFILSGIPSYNWITCTSQLFKFAIEFIDLIKWFPIWYQIVLNWEHFQPTKSSFVKNILYLVFVYYYLSKVIKNSKSLYLIPTLNTVLLKIQQS